jgi:NitT/TauT family transport system permease protein
MNDEKRESIGKKIFENAIVLVVVVIVWTILPQYFNSLYLPPLTKIITAFKVLIDKGELLLDILFSLRVSFAGLGLATASAICLGLLIGWFSRLERYLDPLLQILRNTPVLAILPLFLLFLGIGNTSKIAVVFYAAFFPILLNTIQGVKTADINLIRSAQSMGVRSFGLLFKVILPAASPFILAGFRLSAGMSLLVIVAAEMLGAQYGLGFMIFNYQLAYDVPKMYVGILTLAAIGVTLNFSLVQLEKRLTSWQEKAN